MKTIPMIRPTLALLLVAAAVGCAFDTDPSVRTRKDEVIWGDASRIKYSQASSAQQELATAVGMLVWSEQLTDLGGACPNPDTGTGFDCTTQLSVYTPAQLRARGEVPMCDDGLVEDGLDPVDALACTAFMIGPDTFATAGHCIVPDGFGVSLAEQRSECHDGLTPRGVDPLVLGVLQRGATRHAQAQVHRAVQARPLCAVSPLAGRPSDVSGGIGTLCTAATVSSCDPPRRPTTASDILTAEVVCFTPT
jgi:hypothetical protein